MPAPYNYSVVPVLTNSPSVDAPSMRTNAQSITDLIAVDHVTFNNSNGGQHNQVTIAANNVPGAQPSATQSVLYTNAGTADAAHPQLFWENFNSWTGGGPSLTVPNQINAVKGWALIASGGFPSATVTISFPSTITIANPSDGTYTVTLPANTVANGNYAVMVTTGLSAAGLLPASSPMFASYHINSATSISIFTFAVTTGALHQQNASSLSFVIMQV